MITRKKVALCVYVKKGKYAAFCGGAIIGNRRVLSAAHCFVPEDKRHFMDKLRCKPKPIPDDREIKTFRITAGSLEVIPYENDREDRKIQWRKIVRYRYPDHYDFPYGDIMTIMVERPFVFSQYVAKMPYASKDIDFARKHCLASGFGLLSRFEEKAVLAETMMWVELRIYAKEKCTKMHSENMDDFICTENKLKDVAQVPPRTHVTPSLNAAGMLKMSFRREYHLATLLFGVTQTGQPKYLFDKLKWRKHNHFACRSGDSGGPLVCKDTGDPREGPDGIIVAVVCGESENGNFFTRVSSYAPFLDGNSCSQKTLCMKYYIFIGFANTFLSKKINRFYF